MILVFSNAYALDIERKLGILGDLAELTQKISKDSLLLKEQENQKNISNLLVSKVEFQKKINDLIDIGEGGVTANKISLSKIADITNNWDLLSGKITEIIEQNKINYSKVESINKSGNALLRDIEKIMDSYYSYAVFYNEQEEKIRHLIYTNKQEVYLQKMIKEYLMIYYNFNKGINKSRLSGSINKFDKIIDVLKYGNARHRVDRAPNKEIFAQLKKVKFKWKILKYKLEREPTEQNVNYVLGIDEELSADVRKATLHFEEYYP